MVKKQKPLNVNKKNIFFITSFWPYPNRGGGHIAGSSILESFANNKNINLTIITYQQTEVTDAKDLTNFLEKYKTISNPQIYMIKHTRVRNPIMIPLFWLKQTSYFLERDINKPLKKTLGKLLKEQQFDLMVFDRDLSLGIANHIFKAYPDLKTNTIYFSHNIECDITKNQAKKLSKKYLPLAPLLYLDSLLFCIKEKQLIKKFTRTYAISETDAKYFAKIAPKKKFETYPWGFFTKPLPDLQNKLSKNKMSWPILRTLDTYSWYPNYEGIVWFLKRVWPIVIKLHPKAHIQIAGRGINQTLANLINSTRNAELVGYLEPEEVDPYVKNAPLMLTVVHGGSGIKIKVLRAIANLTPIIANCQATKGLPKDIQKHIPCFESPKKLAKHTAQMLKSAEKRAEQIKAFSTFYKNNLHRKNLETFIQKIIKKYA